MDDFEIEDGSFYNWDSSPSVDYSSFLDSLPELTTPDAGILDGFDISNLLSNIGDSLDLSSLFSSEPKLLNEIVSSYDIEDTPFMDQSYDIQDTPFTNWEPIGDQPGDYDLTGGYGDPLAPGVKEATDAKLLWDSTLASDPGNYVELDKNGNPVIKNDAGKVIGTMTKDANGNTVVKTTSYGGSTAGGGGSGTGGTGGGTTQPKTPLTPGKVSNNAALLAALLGGLLGIASTPKTGGARGYQGKAAGSKGLTASRQALSPTGAPGAGGKRFMTDVTYAAEGGLMGLPYQPNQNVTFMAAGGLPSQAKYMSGLKNLNVEEANKYDQLIGQGYSPSDAADVAVMARGGISDLGSYTHAKGGRMLKGPGDGMSDSIPASIEGKRPARLANDEFVVPADVVSHLGNGSSDAGANVLYDMMARVRKARTGNPDQGKQINPKKYLPR